MDNSDEFNFGDDSVAKAYDSVLVPVLFEPWAKNLIHDNKPWAGNHVLDLACGTGVVTKELALNVQPKGKVIALDINKQMLNFAKLKCSHWSDWVEFIEGSANSLDIPDNYLDKVICQQGFQFFPNKKVVANEIYRVLKPNGKGILSTWSTVSECKIFGVICESLESMNLNELSQLMRIPFDFMPQDKLLEIFEGIGFSNIQISKQELNMKKEIDSNELVLLVYATPIGPKLNALSMDTQNEFKRIFIDKIRQLKKNNGSVGRMVSNVVVVVK